MTDPAENEVALDLLFRGAARMGLLLGALDLPWPAVTPLVAAFPGELRDELDLGVGVAPQGQPDEVRMWLRTTVQGKAGTFRVARFLAAQGVEEDRLRRLLVTAEAAHHQRLLFLLGVGPQGLAQAAWVLRQPLSRPQARGWLEDDGVGLDARARVERVGQILERDTVHALGEQLHLDASAVPGPPAHHLLYFSQPAQAASWARLEQACLAAGLPAERWAAVEARMPDLIGRDARLGLELCLGQVIALRLEVEEVAPAALAALVPSGEGEQRVSLHLELAQRDRLDLCSLRLPLEGPPTAVGWSVVRAASPPVDAPAAPVLPEA